MTDDPAQAPETLSEWWNYEFAKWKAENVSLRQRVEEAERERDQRGIGIAALRDEYNRSEQSLVAAEAEVQRLRGEVERLTRSGAVSSSWIVRRLQCLIRGHQWASWTAFGVCERCGWYETW